jgi:Ser/Thr protein kinase RdoA (MazF antagonist)
MRPTTSAGQPMGWEVLERWGDDIARVEPLAGGVANDVWSVRINGHLAVARLGTRSDADLACETELLQHLDRAGLTVPMPIPATDGRRFADGIVVMSYMDGRPPETEADWPRVADTLRQLHRLTQVGRSVPAGDRRPTFSSPTSAQSSTSVRSQPRASLAAEQRGRGSWGVRRASSTETPATLATFESRWIASH